jgi:glycosyltransferase involved in cell wall biosynthesis
MRVAYVLGTTAGGTGRHVAMLACAVPGEALVAGPSGTGSLFTPSVAFESVEIRDRPRLAGDVLTVLRLGRLLRRFRPGVVHAHGLRAGALTALALSWRRRGRGALVVTVHNAPPVAGGLAAVYGALERIVARRADLVLCVSGDLAARMRRLGAREVDLALVPAPSARSAGQAAAAGSGTAPLDGGGRPVVLGIGRLAPQKRFDVLLRAAATTQWRARRPVPLVVIAGAGPLAGDLDRLGAELGVDARFLGERDDVPALLAAADVFVLPSQWEGQPLILQEALRAGRPIVASDVGGVRDLTGDDAAVLVAPGDPLALSRAVLAVLDDERLAGRLAAAAAARAAKLPAEAAAVASVIGHYDRLARLNAARPGRA